MLLVWSDIKLKPVCTSLVLPVSQIILQNLLTDLRSYAGQSAFKGHYQIPLLVLLDQEDLRLVTYTNLCHETAYKVQFHVFFSWSVRPSTRIITTKLSYRPAKTRLNQSNVMIIVCKTCKFENLACTIYHIQVAYTSRQFLIQSCECYAQRADFNMTQSIVWKFLRTGEIGFT